jgi:hypothetical protein
MWEKFSNKDAKYKWPIYFCELDIIILVGFDG